MQPTVVRLLEAFAACALEDEHLSERVEALRYTIDHVHRQVDRVSRQLDHVRQQNHLLVRLVRQLLEQTPDPAQVARLSEEITQLEAASAQLTDAMEANPNP